VIDTGLMLVFHCLVIACLPLLCDLGAGALIVAILPTVPTTIHVFYPFSKVILYSLIE
jgi:hypothetical protein